MTRRLLLAVAAAVLLVPCVALAAPQATLAEARIGGASIEFAPQVDFSRAVLTVSTPGGQVLRFEGVGTVPSFGLFDAKGQPHADGAYQWELRLSPRMTPELRKELRASRARGEEGSIGDRVVSGSFAIAGGAFVDPGEKEAPVRATAAKAITPTTAADQVIPDDLIVQGSGCFGFDCVNNESFGFDTIRMKENNTRIDFTDTSVGTFPTQDWEIAANDSASGGRNALIVSDEGNQIVVVESGNVSNALYIDDTARIGLRTSTPVLDLHISTSNTPAIRLEQTNAGGFTAQTWDIAGNEANFFVRDVTSGSRLPFRIRPGAPTSSIDISSDGEVGIGGVAADGTELHVISGESRFDSASATLNSHFNFSGNGQNYFRGTTIIADDAVGSNVGIGCDSPQADLVVGANTASCAGGAFTAITAGSAPVTSSSRSFKTNLAAVAVPGILEKVQQVGVFTFDFINGPANRLGLMAEDFHAIFQRGSDKVIDSGEVTSALWLAVQELATRNQELTERLKALEARLPAGETQK
jgi:hypothetical protein